MHASRGFTLIEMTVTLTIGSILLAIAMPAFSGLRQRVGALDAHHRLTASFAVARLGAVKRRHPITVCPSRDGTSCRGDSVWDDGWIVYIDPDRSGQPQSAAMILQHLDGVGDGLALRSTRGRTRVRFSPDGWAYGSNLSVRLCSLTQRTLLGTTIVNNAGRARTTRHENQPCPHP